MNYFILFSFVSKEKQEGKSLSMAYIIFDPILNWNFPNLELSY